MNDLNFLSAVEMAEQIRARTISPVELVDAHLGRISNAPHLAQSLRSIPGVVEHGLFIGLASTAMLAGSQGIRVVERR